MVRTYSRTSISSLHGQRDREHVAGIHMRPVAPPGLFVDEVRSFFRLVR